MITTENTLIERLNRLIDDNLDNPAYTIDAICQTLGVSRSHLHRTVKELTTHSTSHYIRKRRLLRAKELLTGTNLRISEICDAVGINNPQNFSTYFTEEFRISPTQFRKQFAQYTALAPEPAPKGVPLPDMPSEPEAGAAKPTVLFLGFRKVTWIYASIAATLLLAIGTCAYFWLKLRSDQSVSTSVSSLAVLPFVNLGNADGNPACVSIMDDIYTSVAHLDNLNVIARSSSDKYQGTQKGVLQIGEELRVAHVLKGDFLKTGDQVQIKIDIIGTQNDAAAWTKKYSAAYKDIFQLTNQIVADVARQLKLTLDAGKTLARTQNIEAYNAFLQGRQLMNTRTKTDLLAGIKRFDRAISLDSVFAEAYAYKAAATHLLPTSGEAETQENFRLTEQIALTAIRLAPTNSTAYAVLGSLYHATHQWQAAENAFRIALQHNPNDAQSNYWYSLLLRSVGRVDEAVEYSTRAVTLDPLYPVILAGHILNCVYANRPELAKQNIESGRVLFDNSSAFHMVISHFHMQQGHFDQAIAEVKRAIVLNPDDNGLISLQMYSEARAGNRRKAITFLHNLTTSRPWDDYQRSVVYAGLQEADSSLFYLRKAADAGYYSRDTKVNEIFAPYRSSLIFRAVLRRYNLAD
ncbi:helix-turn-helix domain-containing protein [Salmonirosea aquatica]|uniref:Helix-turn-helix domain-containing protein n=1 Tax=Salmonirosea aquatica TaxID=2654236 RepID=A0A7C9FSK5_9BACT|nr:helix-turn-helix domain-containing protein [Cytophagaceae bacterium SJW1-29]